VTRLLGIEVRLNGELLCTAGQKDDSVYVWMDVADWTLPDGTRPPSSLRIEGSKDFVNLKWRGVDKLEPGDEINIRVVEAASFDEPTRKKRPEADAEEAQERLTYEWLRKKYAK
jgi:hypothetical protein